MVKGFMDAIYAFRFTDLMAKPFTRWKAYHMGIIDDKGNLLKKPDTPREKAQYTKFHAVIRNLKQTIQKVGGNTTTVALAVKSGWQAMTEVYGDYDWSQMPMVESDSDLEKLRSIVEEMTAGDSGGDPEAIAKGETSGSVTGKGPSTIGKKKKESKEKG